MFILLINNILIAQDGIGNNNQEILKAFDAQLENAEKLNLNPIIPPVVPIKKVYNYKVTILPLDIKYPAPEIKANAHSADLPFDKNKFHAKLGYGNVKNPKVNIGYYHTDEYKWDYYINGNYYAMDNGSNIENQKMANPSLDFGLKYRFKENMQLEFKSELDMDLRSLYFIHTSDAVPLNRKRNRLNGYNTIKISNVSKTATGVGYTASLKHGLTAITNGKKNETNAILNLGVYKMKKLWKIDIPVEVQGILQKEVADLYSIELNPSLQRGSKKLWIKLGANMLYASNKQSSVWPLVHVDYAISGSALHLFANSNQVVYSNNLMNLSHINPYLSTDLKEINKNIVQTISGGVQTESASTGLKAEAGYISSVNQATFTNISNMPYFSDVKYIDINGAFLKASIDFAFSQNVKLGGNLVKNFYNAPSDEKIYGLHTLELSAHSKIELFKGTIGVEPILSIRDKVWARAFKNDVLTDVLLNNQVDLSVHTKINIRKNSGLYFEANNILNNKYTRWYGYPQIGIHFNGGLLLRL